MTPAGKNDVTAQSLFQGYERSVYQRTDRLFLVLLAIQWVIGVVIAFTISPKTWSGASSSTNPHVYTAVFIGGFCCFWPMYLCWKYPGETLTRHAVAVGQSAFSGLLIHLTGGRIETHFHIFGSLAFLACYRDWRVIVTASVVVIMDHLVRGIYFPFSVYGVQVTSIWRVFEHAVWVVFEDVVLVWSCFVSRREMRKMCEQQCANHTFNIELEQKVQDRTAALKAEVEMRRDAEEKIRASEERYRTLVYNSPQYILTLNREGEIQFVNRVVSGLSRDAVLGSSVYNFISEKYREAVRKTIEAVFESGTLGSYETEGVGPEGGLAFYSTVVAPVKEADKVISVILIANDITEWKKTESDLVRTKEAAEAGNRTKSEFLATMSHEIRTPMNGVIGFTNLLLETPLSEEQKEFCEIIRKSGEGLLELINDILEFSKLEANKVRLEKRLFDLQSAVQTAAAFVSRKASDKKLKLVINFSEASNVMVVGDEIRLRQVLLNLLDNAIKFTASGRVTLDLQIEGCQKHLFKFRFAVTDTGIGIPEEKVGLLFQKFTQIDASTKRRFGGTGLGLAISKQLVELMDGQMGVESSPNHGSTFWFTLPLQVESNGENMALSRDKSLAATRSVAPPDSLSRARILVAEDNPVNRLVLVRMLEKMRCTVALAEDGKEAVRKYRPELYDCVLMDCNMPNMDGYEATSLIRKTENGEQHIPIIAVTANAMNGDRERCLAAGMDDYISKPIQRPELERLLEKHLTKPQSDTDIQPKSAY